MNVDPSQLKSRDSYAQNNNNNKASYVKVVNVDPRQQNTVDSYARNQNNNSKNVDLRPSNNRDSYAGNNNNNARKVGHTSYSETHRNIQQTDYGADFRIIPGEIQNSRGLEYGWIRSRVNADKNNMNYKSRIEFRKV